MGIHKVQTFVTQAMANKKTLSKVLRTGLGVGGAGILLAIGVGLAVKESKGKYKEAEVTEDRLATSIGKVEIRTTPENKIEEARIYGRKKDAYGYIKLQGGADIKFPVEQAEKKGGILGYGSTHYIGIGDTFISAQAVDNIDINTHTAPIDVFVSDCNDAEINVSEGDVPNKVSLQTWNKQISNIKVHLGENDKATFPFSNDSYFDQEYSGPGTYLLKHSNSNDFSNVARIENGEVQDIELPPKNVSYGGVNYDWKSVKKDENGNLMIHEEKDAKTGEILYNVTLENGVVVKYPKQAEEKGAHVDGAHPPFDSAVKGCGGWTTFNNLTRPQIWGSQGGDEITLKNCQDTDIHVDNDQPIRTDWASYGDLVYMSNNSSNTKVHMNEYDNVYNYRGEKVEHVSNDNNIKTKLYKQSK